MNGTLRQRLPGYLVGSAALVTLGFSPALYAPAKRVLDLLIAALVSVPVLLLIPVLGLMIRLDSPGPVLFRQVRIGRYGRPFTMYKLRSMTVDTPVYAEKPDKQDTRITRVGNFLRKTGLDEIPQVINVLRGEMSFIGPRPEMPFIVNEYTCEQRQRLLIRPGVTGLWQVDGERYRPIHENLHLDLHYIERCSLLLDLYVIRRTTEMLVPSFFRQAGKLIKTGH